MDTSWLGITQFNAELKLTRFCFNRCRTYMLRRERENKQKKNTLENLFLFSLHSSQVTGVVLQRRAKIAKLALALPHLKAWLMLLRCIDVVDTAVTPLWLDAEMQSNASQCRTLNVH